MKKNLRDISSHILLTLAVSVAILLVLYFNGNKYLQEFIIIGLSLFYLLWGVLHHLGKKNFSLQIMLEYLAFALLGSILVIGLLK